MYQIGRAAHLKMRLLIAGLATCCLGCGDSNVGSVTGVITLNGDPLAGASVEFVPQNAGGTAVGKTDGDGKYSLMMSRDAVGAPVGKSTVRISTYDVFDAGGEEGRFPELVPAKYNVDSELTAEVTSGSNQIDFHLQASAAEQVTQQETAP